MERKNSKIEEILGILNEGGSCDYAYLQGGVLLFPKQCKQGQEQYIDISTFLSLRINGYIDKTGHMRQGHMRFPANTPIDIYKITEKGKEYLKSIG